MLLVFSSNATKSQKAQQDHDNCATLKGLSYWIGPNPNIQWTKRHHVAQRQDYFFFSIFLIQLSNFCLIIFEKKQTFHLIRFSNKFEWNYSLYIFHDVNIKDPIIILILYFLREFCLSNSHEEMLSSRTNFTFWIYIRFEPIVLYNVHT